LKLGDESDDGNVATMAKAKRLPSNTAEENYEERKSSAAMKYRGRIRR